MSTFRTEFNITTGELVQVPTAAYVLDGEYLLVDLEDPVPPGAVLASSVPKPRDIPQSVTPVQAFTALDSIGKLAELLAYIEAPSTPPLVRASALGATEWKRDSLLLMAVGIVLGLTPVQIDDLFIAAAKVQV